VDRRNCWEVLLDRSSKAVELARQGCLRAANRVQQLDAQMQRLQTLHAEYSNRLRESQDRAHGISQTVSYRNFLVQIGGLMDRTIQDLNAARAVQAAALRDLQRTEQEQNKYEALIEREDLKASIAAEKAEQRVFEELAISRYVQQQRAI
jgi:flagellar export protein FliJ